MNKKTKKPARDESKPKKVTAKDLKKIKGGRYQSYECADSLGQVAKS